MAGHAAMTREDLEKLRMRIDVMLEETFRDIKPKVDDSRTGFRLAWQIVRGVLDSTIVEDK